MSSRRRFGAGGASLLVGLTCLLALTTATPARATTLRRMNLSELVSAADRVVHAHVVANRIYWDPTHTQIHTDTDFEVVSDAKGQGPKKLTITQLGGRIDPIDILVEGTPTFAVGEEVVLFTALHPSGQRLIVGLSQGVMRVHQDPATGDKVAFSGVPGGVTFVGGKPRRSAAPLTSILEQIRQIAAEGRKSSSFSKTPATDPGKPGGGKP